VTWAVAGAAMVLYAKPVAQRVGLSPVKVNMVVKCGVNDAQISWHDIFGEPASLSDSSSVPSSEVVAAVNETFLA
jgi:hypothetical protein